MRITILTVGSRGDVQPYVALGVGLQAAGYTVRLAAHPPFESFVRQRDLAFFPIEGEPRPLLESDLGQAWLETERNPFTFVHRMRQLARPIIDQLLADYWSACQDTDLILYPVLGSLVALSIAEKLGLPAYPAFLQPAHRTHGFPNVMANPQPFFGETYNWLTHVVVEQIFWQLARNLLNQWRGDMLQLPPFPLLGPFRQLHQPGLFSLYGYSPSVLPRPPEWHANIHVTGYWFLDRPAAWRPPADLLDFLSSGSPPVYIGFGSMADRQAVELTDIALQALDRSRQRGLLLSGWGGLSNADLPDHIFKVEGAPHDWLLPKMTAVVHHGGAGTTAAGLRAGVPSILVPFFGDQPFWGWRVQTLGVGPQPIPRRQLSSERLAAAITTAIQDTGMKNRAAALGRKIQAENGVAQAIATLTRQLEAHPPKITTRTQFPF